MAKLPDWYFLCYIGISFGPTGFIFCLSTCLSVCPVICLPICWCVCLSDLYVYVCVPVHACFPIYLSAYCFSVFLLICSSVLLFVYLPLCVFAPACLSIHFFTWLPIDVFICVAHLTVCSSFCLSDWLADHSYVSDYKTHISSRSGS